MVQPLPTAVVPSALGLIEAQRQGIADRQQLEQRELMKRAGGLAAAGNMTGARSELYKGGDFSGASKISDELRAAASHARSLDNDKLERALKGQGLLGRLAESIRSHEQLDAAKARLKGMGLNVDNVTFDQLPSLRQQSLSVQEQLQREMQERQLKTQEMRADLQQSNTDRTFNLNQRKLDILEQKANAKANAKAGAPAKLTEAQRKASTAITVMKDSDSSLGGVLKNGDEESPMGVFSSYVSRNAPDEVAAKYRSKEQNQFTQAAEQWVDAKLRYESGATVTPEEIRKGTRIYFPVPGDDITTRRNKARARKAVEDAIAAAANSPTQATANAPDTPNQPTALPDDPSGLSDDDLMKLLE